MPDEWPRQYTRDEVHAIARSIGLDKINPQALEKLQEAAKAFQWGSLADAGVMTSSTNKARRRQFKRIIKLCEKIEEALNELDGRGSQLLGPVGDANVLSLRQAAQAALNTIPSRGPNPKRARRQFIDHLAPIFSQLTGRCPGRSVLHQEGGLFLKFVKAALEPFKATQGCEADIKAVLHQRKRASGKGQTAAIDSR